MASLTRQTSGGVTLLTDESRPGGVTLAFTERTGGGAAAADAARKRGARGGDVLSPVGGAAGRCGIPRPAQTAQTPLYI